MTLEGGLRPQGPPGIAHDRPTLIKAEDAKRFLWGDERAGFVSDWIYGSSPNIHMMSFALNVGARFGNSPDFKTYYNCHETYYCLKGEFTFHCPETGEVHVLRQGDLLYFPPDTWHWGYNFGDEECRILESLTPRRTDHIEAYAAQQPMLETIRLAQEGLVHGYLPGRFKSRARATLVKPEQHIHEIVGEDHPMRVALGVSTAALTTGFVELHAGQRSQAVRHPGDKVLYQLDGQLNVHFPDEEGSWWELQPGDSAFLPAECRHVFFNTSDRRSRTLFSVAPAYR